MMAIQKDIVSRLNKEGTTGREVKLVVDEVWTTDWINEEARERLRQYGIAPEKVVQIKCIDGKNTNILSALRFRTYCFDQSV